MNRRSLPALLVAIALVLAPVHPAVAAPLSANQTIKLPSGRTAKILSVSKIEYSKGVLALMVRYQTTLSMDEAKAVTQEVDEVWKFAQKEAESDKLAEAIISSNEAPKGIFITANRVTNFIYEKGADGKWARLDRADFMAAE